MQIISLLWGILALFGMFIGFIPCFGALNWLNIPFAFIGLVFSAVAHSSSRHLRRTSSLLGIIFCGIAVLLGLKRLILGGGLF